MKRLTPALLIIGLLAVLSYAPHIALAQSTCTNFGATFPSGWTINQGTQQGNMVYDPSSVLVTYIFPSALDVNSVSVDWRILYPDPNANPLPLETGRLTVRLWKGGAQVDYDSNRLLQGNSGDWQRQTYDFNNVSSEGISVEFTSQNSPPAYVDIRVAFICFGNLPPTVTPAPSWTPSITNTPLPPSSTYTPSPTLTFTSTLTPSNTPVPTDTPVPTETLTPSDTPTGTLTDTFTPGPTDTPSDTPPPSVTPLPDTATPPPPLLSGSFPTPPPPPACQDPFNPCGALPFPIPPFPNMNLPSPTIITAVALAGTPTLLPFQSATPGTGTPVVTITAQFGVYEAATGIAQAVDSIIIMPSLNDADGMAITFQDAGNQIGAHIGEFFSIVRAVQSFFLGKTGNIIAMLLLIAAFIIFVRLLCFAIPILKSIATFIFNIVKMIPFIG